MIALLAWRPAWMLSIISLAPVGYGLAQAAEPDLSDHIDWQTSVETMVIVGDVLPGANGIDLMGGRGIEWGLSLHAKKPPEFDSFSFTPFIRTRLRMLDYRRSSFSTLSPGKADILYSGVGGYVEFDRIGPFTPFVQAEVGIAQAWLTSPWPSIGSRLLSDTATYYSIETGAEVHLTRDISFTLIFGTERENGFDFGALALPTPARPRR